MSTMRMCSSVKFSLERPEKSLQCLVVLPSSVLYSTELGELGIQEMETTRFSSQTCCGTNLQITVVVGYKPKSRTEVTLGQCLAKKRTLSQKTPDASQT